MAPVLDDLIATRSTLIGRLKDWHQSSWKEFFDIYWRIIYVVARKSGLTESEAQEVVQETMIAVARQMPDFEYDRTSGSFRAWLMNLTRWRIGDQFRKRRRHADRHVLIADTRTGTSPIDRIPDQAGPALDKLWDAEWEDTLLEAAVAKVKRKVDPLHYQLFDFYANRNWAPEQVAATFGVTVGQVYTAKHRVSELIKEEVRRQQEKIAGDIPSSASVRLPA